MVLKEKITELEKQKSQLAAKLKELKIKQAQVLRIKQLIEDIAKLNSSIKSIASEVNSENVK